MAAMANQAAKRKEIADATRKKELEQAKARADAAAAALLGEEKLNWALDEIMKTCMKGVNYGELSWPPGTPQAELMAMGLEVLLERWGVSTKARLEPHGWTVHWMVVE